MLLAMSLTHFAFDRDATVKMRIPMIDLGLYGFLYRLLLMVFSSMLSITLPATQCTLYTEMHKHTRIRPHGVSRPKL